MKRVNLLSLAGVLALGFALAGCLNDSGSSAPASGDAHLVISAGVKDVNKTKTLGKASVITLRKLVITLRSSDSTDAVRRDTIIANDSVGSQFKTSATSDQTFSKAFAVKPLRTWTVIVKTLDTKDSVVHYDSAVATNVLVGQTRAITLNLSSRFLMYEAQFSLPDSLNFTQLGLKQQLSITRIQMLVDGVVVTDTSRAPRFAASPAVHSVFFDYIDVRDTNSVKIEFYGKIGADTAVTKLFTAEFDSVMASRPNPAPKTPTYVGPPSNQLSGNLGLTISIGKVGTVVFQPVIDPNVTTKKAVR